MLDHVVNAFYKKLRELFFRAACHLAFPPAMWDDSNCSAFSPALGIARIIYFSHSNKYVVICHRGFNSLNHLMGIF